MCFLHGMVFSLLFDIQFLQVQFMLLKLSELIIHEMEMKENTNGKHMESGLCTSPPWHCTDLDTLSPLCHGNVEDLMR